MSKLLPDGFPEIRIPNDHIANDAGQYRDAARHLFDHLPRLNCVLPLLANAAFSIELYLKSLNAKEVYHEEDAGCYRVTAMANQKGHSLAQLFGGLDEEIKKDLRKSYLLGKVRFASIEAALGAYDEVFVNSRYPFENGTESCRGTINGLVELADFFDDFVKKLQPRFK